MDTNILVLPGIGGSGPQHWQTLWEATDPAFRRVQQRDWDHPDRALWVASLESAVAGASGRVVLVAHSLGCLQVAHWANSTARCIQGALLVAVPDPAEPAFPAEASSFAPVPLQPLPFPSKVVASSDDPYGSVEFAERCARAWRSRFVCIGAAGHINASSNLGSWPEGFELLTSLLAEVPVV